MHQVVNTNLFLLAEDSCLIFQHEDVDEIKKVLNSNFENIFDCFVSNELSIPVCEDNTKSILFASQPKIKSIKNNIKYREIEIKVNTSI